MKISLKLLISMAFFMQLAGCAGSSPEAVKKAPASSPTEAELSAEDDALPEAAVMRVKLDAEGNVVAGSESMRVVAQLDSDSTADKDYANGATAEAIANLDELDQTTSAQSWNITSLGQEAQQEVPAQQQAPVDQRQQQVPGQGAPGSQEQCGDCPQNPNSTICTPCDNQVEHRTGPSTSVYPVSRRTVYEHRTRDVRPVQYVDVYPVETVRVHPTQVVTRVHPLQTQIQYVGNHCHQRNLCGYGAQFYPTVNVNSYQQFYHFQSFADRGGYRYFRYCRPRAFHRVTPVHYNW